MAHPSVKRPQPANERRVVRDTRRRDKRAEKQLGTGIGCPGKGCLRPGIRDDQQIVSLRPGSRSSIEKRRQANGRAGSSRGTSCPGRPGRSGGANITRGTSGASNRRGCTCRAGRAGSALDTLRTCRAGRSSKRNRAVIDPCRTVPHPQPAGVQRNVGIADIVSPRTRRQVSRRGNRPLIRNASACCTSWPSRTSNRRSSAGRTSRPRITLSPGRASRASWASNR